MPPRPPFARFSWISLSLAVGLLTPPARAESIDREALVKRHHPVVTEVDPRSPFTVGNGGFAMTVDVTGLQSFPAAYRDGIPLNTQSDWGWHSFPNPEEHQLADTLEDFTTGDRPVSYPTNQTSPAGQWLRANPHRLGLGRIGFEFILADGSVATVADLTDIHQEMNLWAGTVESSYRVEGVAVTVTTAVFPLDRTNQVGVEIASDLIAAGRVRMVWEFAGGSEAWGIAPEDRTNPGRHSSDLAGTGTVFDDYNVIRELDEIRYGVKLMHERTLQVTGHRDGPHRFVFNLTENEDGRSSSWSTENESAHWLTVEFAHSEYSDGNRDPIGYARGYWPEFWQSGAAVDFTGSTDPRAPELERRIILSQYLTAIQCAGDMPPQETGLTFNSWYGVAHLEMHWWHGVHFALWDRFELLERSLPWYQTILPQARAIAERQGYAGVRWPKMVARDGVEKPSAIAPLLIWQQPHPIYFAELAWRQSPTPETLARYREIVFETAAFMADFARWNENTGHFDLGPPLIPAQESYDPRTTKNPPFELAYWRWGLATAQAWRERSGLPRDEAWDHVINHLAPYPEYKDGYASAEGIWNIIDHPSVLGALGMLPGDGIGRERMRATLHRVMAEQNWPSTWGWDYPLIAMTAARLGEPELAIDALLLDRPKNTFLKNGHNWQEANNLRIYLPGNGALLSAIAMMAGGWDGAPDSSAPGFPDDGSWMVHAEGFHPLP